MVEHLESKKQHDQQIDYRAEAELVPTKEEKKDLSIDLSNESCNGVPEAYMSPKQVTQLKDYISHDL